MNKLLLKISVIAGVFGLILKKSSEPRGIRNNNAGNIEAGRDQWQGAIGDDGRFVIFSAPEYGIRAIARILNSYKKRGVESVSEIISTWAPPTENNTNAYIESVAGRLGVEPFEPLSVERWPELIAAIVHHENGKQPYSAALIKKGVDMAGIA